MTGKMTSFSIFTFCVSLLLMCHTDIFALGGEQKTLLYGCSYSDTCNGNINHQWCFKRSTNFNSFNISPVTGATAGLYECCSSSILAENGRNCCAALKRGERPTVSFNVIVRARPELVCEPSNCRVVIEPNDTSLSLKGVLRPAEEGFKIQQVPSGLWKFNNIWEISQNGTLPPNNNINVTIVGETLLLNGPGLHILNGTEFSFEIGVHHGDSICDTNDQLNTKITYTVVVVDNTPTSSSPPPPPSTSITSTSTAPNSSSLGSTDPPSSEVFWVAIPAVLVPIGLLILLLVACGCYCHCKKKSRDDFTQETETMYYSPEHAKQCYIRVEPALRMECSASPPNGSLGSCESGSKVDMNESEEISSIHFDGNLEDVPSDCV